MRRFASVALAGSLMMAACGESSSEQRTRQIEKAAADVQKTAETAAARGVEGMAQGFERLSKGLSSMTGGDPNAKPVEPLTIDALRRALPELSGWERGTPTGERMSNPVTYAEARVTLTKGASTVDVKIVDSALNPLLVAPFTMFLAVGYEKESARGYERGVKVGDHPGWEKWDSADKDGELNAIVNRRFIVQIEGRNIESAKILRAVMDQTNLKMLADAK